MPAADRGHLRECRQVVLHQVDFGLAGVISEVHDNFDTFFDGREGQALQWLSPGELYKLDFLAANEPIMRVL